MSHCLITARLPAVSIQPTARNNRYIISTSIMLNEDRQFDASLYVYLESPPQQSSLLQLDGAGFANNGGTDISLSTGDMREMEVLGHTSPAGMSLSSVYCPYRRSLLRS